MNSIEWEALEHHHDKKSSDWYYAVGIIAAAIIFAAIMFGNLTFAIFILVSTVTLCMLAARPPRIFEVNVSEVGVIVGNSFYRKENLRSFWINEEEFPPALLLESSRPFFPYIVIRLEDTPPDEVRELLLQYLPEKKHEEPLLQKIAEYLGF
jgi:hypothetical protein